MKLLLLLTMMKLSFNVNCSDKKRNMWIINIAEITHPIMLKLVTH